MSDFPARACPACRVVTPVPCGACRQTARRSGLAERPGHRYRAAHPRRYRDRKPSLFTTPGRDAGGLLPGQPRGPGSAAAAELSAHAARAGTLRPGLVLIGDKGFARRDFDKPPRSERAVSLARPDRRDEAPRHGPAGRIRQWTGPVNDTLNRQPGLEHHGGRTTGGLHARIAQRTPAMATRTRHNRYRRARQTIADRQRPPNP